MRAICALLCVGNWMLAQGPSPGIVKPTFSNVRKLNAYADNWCVIYVNGKMVGFDSIDFLPHNVVSVNILPVYPLTIAVLAKDNADPKTGLEYGNQIGDAGFILKLADGTVTSSAWKAKSFFRGPLNRDVSNPRVEYDPIPANWFATDFDDSSWTQAKEYPESQVRPDGDYSGYDFTGAKFIWTDDLELDNTVIFRYTVPRPPGWSKTWNADGDTDSTNIVVDGKLGVLPSPSLFTVNADGAATGYLTRVRGTTQFTEQFATNENGTTTLVPVDVGPEGDQVFVVLYGANLNLVSSATATVGGLSAEVKYAGQLTPGNGVAQFNVLLPRALSGRGVVELVLTVNGKASNPVSLRIR